MKRALTILSVALLWPVSATAQFDAPRGAQPAITQPAPEAPSSTPVTQNRGAQAAPSAPTRTTAPATPATRTAPPPQATGDDTMRFALVTEGPAERCGGRCPTWVSASGRITNDTAADFERFVNGRDLRDTVVVLDSGGGSVYGGLELGNAIRRLGLSTTVGKTTMLPPTAAGEQRATLAPKAYCASMCAFVLIAGVRRHVPTEAQVLVHQIWPSDKRDDATAAAYTAQDVVNLQRTLGGIARYVAGMGADVELFDISMRIPPWERLRELTSEELRRLRVTNTENAFDGPVAEAPMATPMPVKPISAIPSSTTGSKTDNGWTLVDKDGLRGLARRHPLTVEGEQIGSFEIMFACGEKPGAYALRYAETRLVADAPSAAARLKTIIIGAGRDRITLTIDTSATEATRGLETAAHGAISVDLLGAYGAVKGRAIVIATEAIDNTRTMIRVGNTGLAPSLPELATACRA